MQTCLCGGLSTRTSQLNGLTDIHFESALVVLGRREVSQLTVPLDKPERSCDDADTDRRVPSFEPLKGRHRNAQALRPGPQRFFSAQAGHGQVSAQFFDSSRGRWRKLEEGAGCLWHEYRL